MNIRRALTRWGFNTKQRSDPPDEIAYVLAWVARNSAPVLALTEAANARRMLDQATGRLDGRNAAASTARRHRIILANAMDYVVELGLLETTRSGRSCRIRSAMQPAPSPRAPSRAPSDPGAASASRARQ